MKRWLSILAVFGCIVALSGCKNENEKRQAYFNAKVLEINKEYVDVRWSFVGTQSMGIGCTHDRSLQQTVVLINTHQGLYDEEIGRAHV